MPAKKPRRLCMSGCGNEIRGNATKYCSLYCCHKVQKKSRGPCANCGRVVGLHKNIYCSLRCMHEQRRRFKAKNFIVGGGFCGPVSSRFLQRLLRDLYGERCSRCGWSERHKVTGNVPVEIEHIDGNWLNNRLSNLTLLCPNCHSLTSTFRALNRGRGRAHRAGGRDNPIRGVHGKTTKPRNPRLQEVPDGAPLQLRLQLADVAQLARARTL